MNYSQSQVLIAIIAIGVAAMIICVGYNYSHNPDSGLSEDDVYGLLETYGGEIRLSDGSVTYVSVNQTESSYYDSSKQCTRTDFTKRYADVCKSGDVLILECYTEKWSEWSNWIYNTDRQITVGTTIKTVHLDSIIGIVVNMPSETIHKSTS